MSRTMFITVIALLCASTFVFAQQWAGVYTTTIGEADAPPEMKAVVGNWELVLGDEGQFTSSRNGEVVVRGNYVVTGDQMTFSDTEGSMSCTGEVAAGTYSPALDGAMLTFTLVDDECAGRRVVLTSHALTKQPAQSD